MRLHGAPDLVTAPHLGVSGLWMVQNAAGVFAWCLHGVPALVVALHMVRVSTFVVSAVCAWAAAVQKMIKRKRSVFFMLKCGEW